MKDAFKEYFSPIADVDRGTLVAVMVGLCALTIYLYQGKAPGSLLDAGWGQGLRRSWAAMGWQYGVAILLLFLLPLLWARFGMGLHRADLGICLGDWRWGFGFLGLAMVVLAPLLWVNAGSPDFQAEYPLVPLRGEQPVFFVLWELTYLVYYVAWEFFFRGFWQLGLKRGLGVVGAMALQTGVSVVMHIGKPEGETLSAILAGPVFGLAVLRSRSLLYVLLLHWYVGAMTDLFCVLRAG